MHTACVDISMFQLCQSGEIMLVCGEPHLVLDSGSMMH